MKILVLATNYSRPDGFISLQYIHTRNKLYVKKGIDVSVISFAAKNDYELDGVKVYTPQTYKNKLKELRYDILISHAPNLKNHYTFLKKYAKRFNNIIFFFHGHEVLMTSGIYPKPYDFNKRDYFISSKIRYLYDKLKLSVWRNYLQKIAYKSQFVFVSNWMYKMFIKYTKLNPDNIEDRKYVIYNCVGQYFENNNYEIDADKEYDFITIRNNLDGSKYGIDIVTRIAENNPQYKFCVVGKGEFYKYNNKPNNLIWIDKNLSHEEIITYLNRSRCALMPTRADAQGVMACEMATFGIPLITSDLDVCKEVFNGFKNVRFINNNDLEINIEPIFKELMKINVVEKNTKFFAENTIEKEISLFNKLKEGKK